MYFKRLCCLKVEGDMEKIVTEITQVEEQAHKGQKKRKETVD